MSSEGGSAAGQSVDATLEHIRRGDIVSRPQWEDVYTSLAKPRQPDNKASTLNMVGCCCFSKLSTSLPMWPLSLTVIGG